MGVDHAEWLRDNPELKRRGHATHAQIRAIGPFAFNGMRGRVESTCTVCGLPGVGMLDLGRMADLPEGTCVHRECFDRVWDALWNDPTMMVGEMKAMVGAQVRAEKGLSENLDTKRTRPE